MSDLQQQSISIETADGHLLGGSLFPTESNNAVAIINSATSVPHQFYRRYAQFLQKNGVAVVTYDYRGIGESATTRSSSTGKSWDAKCQDWGLLDIPAVLGWVENSLHPEKIFLVGHSAGGQQAGLIDNPETVNAMITVCAQSGYWKLQGGIEKLKVCILVYAVIPILVKLLGYLPWSRLGNAEDLPGGIALQWARWCRDPAYLLGDSKLPLERFNQFTAPVLAYSIDDDNWGTAQAVDALTKPCYPQAERRHILPADYRLDKVGHMGFFRKGSEALWQETLDWLQQH